VDLICREVLPKSQERNNKPINLVSAIGREEWADVFIRLEKANPDLTEAYKDALFVLALDKTVEPKPGQDREDALMHQVNTGRLFSFLFNFRLYWVEEASKTR
jgi:hypothetical protein